MEFAEIWNMCVSAFSALSLHIFNVGISASFFALAVIIFRAIFKKCPRWLIVALWALVAIRLICPVAIESKMSLVPSAETLPYEEMFSADSDNSDVVHFDIVKNPHYTEFAGDGNQVSVSGFQTAIIPIGMYIWFWGVVIMLFYAFISFLRLRHKVRTAIAYEGKVWVCDEVKTPFILGFFHPRIYLPSDIDEGTTELVLHHEKAHLKRKDHLWKPLGFILLSVYWFNPVLWVSYILLCRDIELACDEKVIKDMGNAEKKAYSQALLSCSTSHRMISACPVAFGEVGVKKRIKSVLNYKKPAFWVILVAIVVSVIIAVCFMTDPKSENGDYDTINGVDEISELLFKMNDIVFSAKSYTIYEGNSTTDYYFDANYEDAFCYTEVSTFLDTISLGKLADGVVNPMHEPHTNGIININYDDIWTAKIIFHDDFQKMYMTKFKADGTSVRSNDYVVLEPEQARKFFAEKPYSSHSLVWEFNPASSTWGNAEINVFIDEKYKINGEVSAEGVTTMITDEESGLEGISWRPLFVENPSDYNIEIPVIRDGKESVFSLTMTMVGKRGIASYYTIRGDDLVIACFPEKYKLMLSEAESENELLWIYNPTLSAVAYGEITFVVPDGYTIASRYVKQKGKHSFFGYNADAGMTDFSWSPLDADMTSGDAEMNVTAIKDKQTIDFKFTLKMKSEDEYGGNIYEIEPENCRITEKEWGVFLLEEN